MDKIMLKELYDKAADRVKELYPNSKIPEWIKKKNNIEYIDPNDCGKDTFREVLNEYLVDIIGKGDKVEIYGKVIKNVDIFKIEISCILCKEETKWQWELGIKDKNFQEVSNKIYGRRKSKSKSFNEGDYVTCILCANESLVEILIKNRPFSFDWESLRKVDTLGENSKYICNLVRILKNPKNGDVVAIPLGENLTQILDSNIKDKSDRIDKLEIKINDLDKKEKMVNELDSNIIQKSKELSELEEKINDDNNRILKNEEKISKSQKENSALEESIEALKKEIEEVSKSEAYNAVKFAKRFILKNEKEDELLPKVDFAEFNISNENFIDELVEYMQGYMFRDGFVYSKDILKNTFYALQTNQLIIYAGKPGSGKSQLVKHIASLFGAAYADVAVQSSWMDKSDLLGFYDPIHSNYVGMPFVDKLQKMCIEAEHNPKRLFIICLDEMNLAHVEYYFADFLSRLQGADNERFIELYSERLEKSLKEEVLLRTNRCSENINDDVFYKDSFLSDLDRSNVDEFIKVKKMWNMIREYPHKIIIPKNVKFFGTINTDATTKDLSPKVLDRSFVFKLEREKFSAPVKGKYDRCVDFYSLVKNVNNIEDGKKKAKMAVDRFCDLNNDLNAGISRRVEEQLAQIEYANETDLVDLLLACIILPKINGISMDKANQTLKQLCDKYPYSSIVYSFVEKNCKGSSYYSFWR